MRATVEMPAFDPETERFIGSDDWFNRAPAFDNDDETTSIEPFTTMSDLINRNA